MDLNSDVGESYGAFTIGQDEDMVPLVSSINVACGFHGGDPAVIHNTIHLAKQHGVGVGAHPSFPDLQGFGRRPMQMKPDDLYASIIYQIGAVEAFTRIHSLSLQHVKPHGALNNLACVDRGVAEVVVKAVKDYDSNLILLAPFGSQLDLAGDDGGLTVASEVYADRNYEPDGTLRSRNYDDALLTGSSEVVQHVLHMIKNHEIVAVDGTSIPVEADSICLHGDGQTAVELAKAVRTALEREGIAIQPLAVLKQRDEL
ncbi:LamB/YcsF family protein [Alicyclobacillus sp. SO9]|uniref:LamB/YcsF family protein n=1 Tax=Alicyclobacillus sp. SO9 TaxID=2665646 RepID=UPI0018E7C424|nr:5-oxoprolinase subunit PxpA [Alicyclobacillus sp. SO9]QQE78727.1 LamB/YcsF family protein [Alicyclobacillus sp. SO9]